MMSNSYVIHWRSKVNGRVGRGHKLFSREEADRLVQELNEEYPEIEHNAVEASASEPTPESVLELSRPPTEPAEEPTGEEQPETAPKQIAQPQPQDPETSPAPDHIISTAE